jgi:hypothetical protein
LDVVTYAGICTGITSGADPLIELGNIAEYGYRHDGYMQHGGVYDNGVASSVAGDVIGFALDMGAGTLAVYGQNALIGTWTGITGTYYPAASPALSSGDPCTVTAHFTTASFVYTPPAGFIALT